VEPGAVMQPTVAFVQDHLVQRGGAERALLSMLKAAPGATVVTPFYDPELCYPEYAAVDIRSPWPNRVGAIRRHHRAMLPALPLLLSSMRVDADVVICGTSGWAQGVRTDGRKIVYFYALTRWLYEREAYLKGSGALPRVAASVLARPLEWWDRRTMRTGDRFVTEGTAMRDRLREIYGIEADIIPLPNTLDPAGSRTPARGVEPGFFLSAGRLMPYKNVDVLVRAFESLPAERLVVAGDGPLWDALRASAPGNVTFLGSCNDDVLRWLYANCAAVISAAIEPFGLTPVEGATFGRPTVALAAGGFVDTVIDGATGVHFEGPDPALVVRAIRRFRSLGFDPDVLVRHAEQYSEARFVQRIAALIAEEGAR
jgi:glycosyltransferase involved in cell wall biosynthesis